MRPFTVRTFVSARREEVFDFIADLAARPAWTDHYARDFRLARARASGEGAAARFAIDPPGPRIWVEVAITEADRPRRVVEHGGAGRRGRTQLWAVYELTQEAPGLTRVELTIWTDPATRIDALKESLGVRGWLRRRSRTSLERLRMALEDPPEAPLARVGIAGYDEHAAPRFGASPRHGVAAPADRR